MKKAITIIAAVIFLTGIAHISLAPIIYKTLSVDTLWYSCTGLALLFLAFLNIVIINSETRKNLLFLLGHVANILCAIGIALLVALTFAPQIILLLLFVLVETALLLWYHIALTHTNSTHNSPASSVLDKVSA